MTQDRLGSSVAVRRQRLAAERGADAQQGEEVRRREVGDDHLIAVGAGEGRAHALVGDHFAESVGGAGHIFTISPVVTDSPLIVAARYHPKDLLRADECCRPENQGVGHPENR